MKLRNAVGPLIIANILMFILQLFIDGFTESFMLVQYGALTRPWIMVTSMFLHGSPNHLLFNMYALWMFGPLIETKIGTKRFLGVYFLAGILAAFISNFVYPAALGASGAIMAILGLVIMLLPNLKVLFLFFIPMTMRTAGFIFALIDIFGIFYPNGTANVAHLVGLGIGLLFGYYLIGKKKTFHKKFTAKKHHTTGTIIELNESDVDEYLKYGRI